MFNWPGTSCHPALDALRQSLAPDEEECFNECRMRLFRDPRTDNIRRFPFGSGALEGYYLYRDNDFAMLYHWLPLGDVYEPWNAHVRILGAARAEEFERDPQVIWMWRKGGYGKPHIM